MSQRLNKYQKYCILNYFQAMLIWKRGSWKKIKATGKKYQWNWIVFFDRVYIFDITDSRIKVSGLSCSHYVFFMDLSLVEWWTEDRGKKEKLKGLINKLNVNIFHHHTFCNCQSFLTGFQKVMPPFPPTTYTISFICYMLYDSKLLIFIC